MKKVFIILLILYFFTLPAYSQKNVNLEIKPSIGLGNLVQLYDVFNPDRWGNNYTKFSGYNGYSYDYPSYGLCINVNFNNIVNLIMVKNSTYQTKEGIKVGTSIHDVSLYFGKPYFSYKNDKDGSYTLCYDGIIFTLGSNKIVKEISIVK